MGSRKAYGVGAKKKNAKTQMRKRTRESRAAKDTSKRKIKRRNLRKEVDRDVSGVSAQQLMMEVGEGKSLPLYDPSDPRAIADMLAKPAEDGTLKLEDTAVIQTDRTDLDSEVSDSGDKNAQNKNFFKRRGQSYRFWESAGLHENLIKSLKAMKFTHPTPVQSTTLPTALKRSQKNLVVSAETGSGKTLVFGLPILHSLLKQIDAEAAETAKRSREAADEDEGPKRRWAQSLHSLILTPTRELALQIKQAMGQLVQCCPGVRVSCIVGGMAPTKQQRLLNARPDILICTPGRVWDLVQKNEGCFLGHSLSMRLHYVVLDEADKLLQSGRFAELQNVLERIGSEELPHGVTDLLINPEEGSAGTWDEEKQEFIPLTRVGAEAKNRDDPRPMEMPPPPAEGHRVTTIITSATLSLQVHTTAKTYKSQQFIKTTNTNTMENVLHKLGIEMKSCEVFNLQGEAGSVVAKISETFLRCPDETKDLYLYYFLRTFEGQRTIIFVNAISMIRRLVKILELLQLEVTAIHASMQQRQRLKNIDRFRTGAKTILIATDVASRGLDIEGVRYVLHFQLPRSTDAYIHRCGRTARCGDVGFSCVLVSPSEHTAYQKLMQNMKRAQPVQPFAVDHIVVHKLHPHMKVVYQLDKLSKECSKGAAEERWVRQQAAAIDVEVEDDMLPEGEREERQQKAKAIKVLRKRLDVLIKSSSKLGAKGAFRSAATTVGAVEATSKIVNKAKAQTYTK